MFTLVSGAYKYLTRQDEYNILILGLDGAGKTTLLERVKSIYTESNGMPPDKILPTVGVNIGKITIKKTLVKFMDMGGQKDLQGIWESYYTDGHGLVYVIDSTNEPRLRESMTVLERLMRTDELDGIPVLVLANKQDLADQKSLVVVVKELANTLVEFIDSRDLRVAGVSAVSGEGVRSAVEWVCGRVVENNANRPPITN